MTIKERITSVYRDKKPDQIPLSIYSFLNHYGDFERISRNYGLGIIDISFGSSLLSPPFFIRSECLSEVKNCSFKVEYKWDNGEQIEIQTFETPVGSISQHLIKDPAYGSNWRKKYYIETVEDYKIVQYIVENTKLREQRELIHSRQKLLGDDGVVLSRLDRTPYQKLLIELAGPERFLIDLHTHKSVVTACMQAIGYQIEEQFRLGLQSDAEFIWLPDNISSDMTPPNAFLEYHLPLYEKFSRDCGSNNKILIIHMDGRIKALKELIAAAPYFVVDSLSLQEMGGDMTISEVFNSLPEKVICPNFPSVLSLHSKKEIEFFINDLLRKVGPTRPFMLQISEDIPLDTYDYILPLLSSYLHDYRQ